MSENLLKDALSFLNISLVTICGTIVISVIALIILFLPISELIDHC